VLEKPVALGLDGVIHCGAASGGKELWEEGTANAGEGATVKMRMGRRMK
jgi:hypothetical protein